jgi:hypothetical protein
VAGAARPRARPSKAERGAGSAAAVPRSGAALDFKYGPIQQCNDLIDCPIGPWQVAVLLQLFVATTLGHGHRVMSAVHVERFVERRAG